jgi:predicted GNAT superfamily acetyltransferase
MSEVSSTQPEIIIRPCTTFAEFAECVDVQDKVWGYDDSDRIPQRVFMLAYKVGGQVFGAFAGDKMAGFAMALVGYRNGHVYLHSHMLAVLPEFRNAGLGRRMKLAQRNDALARGIDLIEWTFDPLEIKNSWLNITRLGAIVRRYTPDFYGFSTSPLQGGLPTDRLHAEWWLRSQRVEAALSGNPIINEPVAEKIEVSHEIYAWKQTDAERPLAQAAQQRIRGQFLSNFAQSLTVIGYSRNEAGDGTFQLGHWNEDWRY